MLNSNELFRITYRNLRLIAVMTMGVLSILGTGGGGGGGGEINNKPQGIPYVGNTNPAIISTTNAARLVANVAAASGASSIIVGPAVAIVSSPRGARESSSQIGLAHLLNTYMHEALSKVNSQSVGQPRVASSVPVDQITQCDNGGSIHIVGTLNNDGTGTLTATYNNCQSGDTTLNGVATVNIYKFDFNYSIITDATFSFTLLTITSPGESASASGSFHNQLNITANTETMTINMVIRDNLTGEMMKDENLVIVDIYDSVVFPSSYTESVSGRVYDSIHGYIDLTTATPLVFSSINQIFPETGQLLFTGAAAASIRVSALSAILIRLQLDLNADSIYETTAVLRWTDLGSPIGADVGDNDGDGMHNSWETAYGLDPSDPADAQLDKDGDGFTNLQEYLAGTDPTNAASTPPTADLEITTSVTPGPLVAGATFSYTVTLFNWGPSEAIDVVLTDVLPAGLSLVSVDTPLGSCSGSSTVVCNLGTIAPGISYWGITLNVTASALGDYENTASVTSSTIDGSQSNNSATVTATVVPPSADLVISNFDDTDPIAVGDTLTYTIVVYNLGPTAATDVVVTDVLPMGLDFVSATSSAGSCTGSSTVICNLGAVYVGWSQSISLSVTPTELGIYHNTASVISSAMDTDLFNNSDTATTTVGTSAGNLQDLIDAANSGETVLVPPGLYVGSINFNGKNISLVSSAGPSSTIIHGDIDTAVKIGPGGTISGFTITGARADIGAGISVEGIGSIISGNTFDGNTGSIGAAIFGNSASPLIERNIFRYNSCDNQYSSGVVAFSNLSSPVIVNNIFEHNRCRGINLTLPVDNTPLVINNTFVGNSVAIRVDCRVSQNTQTYRNNILFQNGIGLEVDLGTELENPTWQNNLVFGNTTDYQGIADQTGVNSNISADPLFVGGSTAPDAYHLKNGSPAIDSGTAVSAPNVDFDGTARPLDGNNDGVPEFDIGAFEFSP